MTAVTAAIQEGLQERKLEKETEAAENAEAGTSEKKEKGGTGKQGRSRIKRGNEDALNAKLAEKYLTDAEKEG